MTTTAARLLRPVAHVLSHDFCPQWNRWFYWMKQPFAALLLAAATAASCAWFVGAYALVPCAALLLVLFLGYCWPTIAVRGLRDSLRFDTARTTEGEAVPVLLRVENRWPFPVWGLSLRQGLSGEGDEAVLSLARVPGSGTSEYRFSFAPPQRGTYPYGPSFLATAFPFGLRTAVREVSCAGELLVWPRTLAVDSLLDSADVRPSEEFLSEERIGDAGDMLGTRAFREGDPLRRVHWKQTARHGELIVCERQAPALSAVRVLLETSSAAHAGSGPDGTLEWSIRIAATLCCAYHAQHADVCCRIGRENVPIGPGPSGLRRFLDRLARIPRSGDAVETPAGSRAARSGPGLTIRITTDRDAAPHGVRAAAGGQECVVVLSTSAGDPWSSTGARTSCGCRPTIVLDRREEFGTQFRRAWRRVCHAG